VLTQADHKPKFAPAHKSLGRFWIGLAIAATIVLMGLSAWRQGWFTPTANLYLELANGTQGIQIGTLVKLKGFKVGEVDEIVLKPDLNVRVRMRVVEERLNLLGADAEVKLVRDSPIGAKYIEIVAGQRDKGLLKADNVLPLHTGGDVEDIMLIVKGAVEKLSTVIGKIDPILDDAKKLSGEAADMRKTVRTSADAMLVNLQALTTQLKTVGQTANGMASNIEADRAVIMAQIKTIVQTLEGAIAKDVPLLSAKTQATLDDVKAITENAKKISNEAAVDLPPALRSSRSLTQDIAEITEGAKSTWPISSMVKQEPTAKPLSLDAFEGKR
jgi:phospholipid/cholesterol/gamma-HCH transport system substrate-binding protein